MGLSFDEVSEMLFERREMVFQEGLEFDARFLCQLVLSL